MDFAIVALVVLLVAHVAYAAYWVQLQWEAKALRFKLRLVEEMAAGFKERVEKLERRLE